MKNWKPVSEDLSTIRPECEWLTPSLRQKKISLNPNVSSHISNWHFEKKKQMRLVYHPRLMFVDFEIQMYCDLTIIKLRNSEGC